MPSETPCPECGKVGQYVRLPCEECPEVKLQTSLDESNFQALLNRCFDLEFLLNQPGASIAMDDMTVEEFHTVQLIKSERARYTIDMQKDQLAKQQRKQARQQQRR